MAYATPLPLRRCCSCRRSWDQPGPCSSISWPTPTHPVDHPRRALESLKRAADYRMITVSSIGIEIPTRLGPLPNDLLRRLPARMSPGLPTATRRQLSRVLLHNHSYARGKTESGLGGGHVRAGVPVAVSAGSPVAGQN
jgi:hypothetical protein